MAAKRPNLSRLESSAVVATAGVRQRFFKRLVGPLGTRFGSLGTARRRLPITNCATAMSMYSGRSPRSLPPTVNLHLVASCNMRCRYCYAHFQEERREQLLPLEHVVKTMGDLARNGVRRVTFAGGEPTLHPRLRELLEHAGMLNLVTSVVSNGARIDRRWIDTHGPFLRWLTLSIDSVDPQVARQLGRHAGSSKYSHPDHVLEVAQLIHEWNAARPHQRQIRLKLNITVTAYNVHENPRAFIERMGPTKVKVLQMLMVKGENDEASNLQCSTDSFANYVDRLGSIQGVEIVCENNDAMDGSYGMVDPMGRFYQRVDGEYKRSEPIHQVGAMSAWEMVGGFDGQRFIDRGGDYEPGNLARGNLPFLVAIEGLDGTGKSTIAKLLADGLRGTVVRNPPEEMAAERSAADSASPEGRRAWYMKGNHRAAQIAEVTLARDGVPVVMDRSVASTLAFGAAESASAVAPWPGDIRRPDLLVLLTVPEPERQMRIRKRGQGRTPEEGRLDRDHEFRARVLRNYQALGATPVDATGSVEEVVARIMRLLHRADSAIAPVKASEG